MKNAGILLMVLGALLLIGFGFFQLITVPADMPAVIRYGLLTLLLGLLLAVIGLVFERIKERKEEQQDDFSKY